MKRWRCSLSRDLAGRRTPRRARQSYNPRACSINCSSTFPRTEFGALVKKHDAERAAKGFTCWTQFVAMLFCQLGRADSLREICNGLGCCLGKLVHLGIAKAPRALDACPTPTSTALRQLFEDLF